MGLLDSSSAQGQAPTGVALLQEHLERVFDESQLLSQDGGRSEEILNQAFGVKESSPLEHISIKHRPIVFPAESIQRLVVLLSSYIQSSMSQDASLLDRNLLKFRNLFIAEETRPHAAMLALRVADHLIKTNLPVAALKILDNSADLLHERCSSSLYFAGMYLRGLAYEELKKPELARIVYGTIVEGLAQIHCETLGDVVRVHDAYAHMSEFELVYGSPQECRGLYQSIVQFQSWFRDATDSAFPFNPFENVLQALQMRFEGSH